MGIPAATGHWRIDDSGQIDWREWGDEFVVRVASRDETHLLSAAAGAILRTLLDDPDPLTLEALYRKAFEDEAGDSCGQEMPATENESVNSSDSAS